MKLHDGKLKNFLRGSVKLLNKHKYDKYVKDVKERSAGLEDFTLLTSDCMAGLIYHTMGRRFLSPTINMSIRDSDFLKFLTDMDYYFDNEIRFIESETYPKGLIGEGDREIKIYFEHYKTNDEAREKWDDRKKRITDNIFVVVADLGLSDDEIDTFRNLEKYINVKRKIMFTWDPEHADGKEIFCVKPYGRQRIKKWSKIRKDGYRDYEVFFDYVAWLNMEDTFMLEQV